MKILLYGDISLNVLDGSSIWLLSTATALSEVCDEVVLLLKEQLYTEKLVRQLGELPNLRLLSPADSLPLRTSSAADRFRLSPAQAAERIAEADASETFAAVFVRGLQVSGSAVSHRPLAEKLWSYITDLPYPPSKSNARDRSEVENIARSAKRMFAQTEAARSYLESIAPSAAGKTLLMPPMIPETTVNSQTARGCDGKVRICYAGKFAQGWMTREMLDIPRALSAMGVDSELWVIGDKFQDSRTDPHWAKEMRQALDSYAHDPTSGVKYFGGLTRNETIDLMRRSNFGLSWRSQELDSSIEVSTKVLEYISCDAIPLMNASPANRELLGEDYPCFIPEFSTVKEIARLIRDVIGGAIAKPQLASVVEGYTISAAVDRLERQLRSAGLGAPDVTPFSHRRRVITFASHDPKFLGELMAGFDADPEFEVFEDRWLSLHSNDVQSSRAALQNSDIVFCEWAGPNLVWYAEHKRPGQVLLSRFHGFEINGPWMRNLDFGSVDHLVFVSEHHRRTALEKFGLPEDKTSVIPNAIETADFERTKHAGSEYRLGLLGFVPFLKRPDRAIALLERLVTQDDRYYLHIKGRPPWEYPHVWNNPFEQQLYLEFYNRLRSRPHLQDHVVFEPFSPDIANWFRRIGTVLSPSDRESFHMAVAEGMASGSVPAIWSRLGAREIFGPESVFDDLAPMAERVLSLRDPAIRANLTADARSKAAEWSSARVVGEWKRLLAELGRARFDGRTLDLSSSGPAM